MKDSITRTPAKAGDATNWRVSLFHNVCDFPIRQTFNGWTCDGPCHVWWKQHTMAGFNDDAMATRFHTRVAPDTSEYTIVWVTNDAGKRHTKLVPAAEAAKYERFKL